MHAHFELRFSIAISFDGIAPSEDG